MLPPELFFAACLWAAHPGVPNYAFELGSARHTQRASLSGLTDLLFYDEEVTSTPYFDTTGYNNTLAYVAQCNENLRTYGHYPKMEVLVRRFGNEQHYQEAYKAIRERLVFIDGHTQLLHEKVRFGTVNRTEAEELLAGWERRIEFWMRIAGALEGSHAHPSVALGRRQHLQLALLQIGPEKFHNLEWPNLWDWYQLDGGK